MSRNGLFWVLMTFLMVSGCARVHEVRGLEGDGQNQPAYQSLGRLEVQEPVQNLTANRTLWGGVEAASLTLLPTPGRGETYKAKLRAKLSETASEKYGADAVINVEYWPDPDSKEFPDGIIHARGEMIRYEKFGAPANSPST